MPDLSQHLESKTNGALLILLAVIIGLSLSGHLTDQAVEALKYVGGMFFGVRAVANLPASRKDAE